MNWSGYVFMLNDSPLIVGGESNAPANNAATGETAAVTGSTTSQQQMEPQSSLLGGMNTIFMVLVYVALFGAVYFFTIRPQRKREKQMQELQNSIRPGDNVITSGGLYGKVVSIGEDCFVLEFGTNRGVRVPVRKSDIMGIKAPNINPSSKEISGS